MNLFKWLQCKRPDMLDGTEREVLELLLERPRSPTEVADELDVSVQTASRNLKRLVEREFAERTRNEEGRGYKQYRAREFAQIFTGYDGSLFERTLKLTDTQRLVMSILKVPQTEFQQILLSRLFFGDDIDLSIHAEAVVLYGSVARGEATRECDVDLLITYDPEYESDGEIHRSDVDSSKSYTWWGGPLGPEIECVVSEEWFTVSEFRDAVDAGSQFLKNVLDEGITLYDPEGVIRGAKRKRAGERVPQ